MFHSHFTHLNTHTRCCRVSHFCGPAMQWITRLCLRCHLFVCSQLIQMIYHFLHMLGYCERVWAIRFWVVTHFYATKTWMKIDQLELSEWSSTGTSNISPKITQTSPTTHKSAAKLQTKNIHKTPMLSTCCYL